MSLLSVNCRVTEVLPSELVDDISVTPGMPLKPTSSGVATAEAMVSGLAPGRRALIWMVGNSASGSGATGRRGKANRPSSTRARVSSVVATGCEMHQADRPRPTDCAAFAAVEEETSWVMGGSDV